MEAQVTLWVCEGDITPQGIKGDHIEAQKLATLSISLLILWEAVDVREADGAEGATTGGQRTPAGGQRPTAAPRGHSQGAGR